MICWQMGKTFCKAKTPQGEFKVNITRNLLINNRAVTSMRNLITSLAYPKISTYSWTFAPIPNWIWSYSNLLSFDAQIFNLWLTLMHGSEYVTNLILCSNLNDSCWLQYPIRLGLPSLQYPIGFGLIATFFPLMHESSICD